jgi:peptide deformylase
MSGGGEQRIVQVGDPVLRRRARDLSVEEIRSDEIQELVVAMRDAMRAAPGVGLAAPQIGLPLRIAVVEDRAEYLEGASAETLAERERAPVAFHVVVNPRLTIVDETPVEFYEGCLSFAGFVGLVSRARAVRVDALDERGEPVTIEASGWHARILQHEIDHLDGIVCVDRMWLRSLTTVENYASFWAGESASAVRDAIGTADLRR